MREIDGRTQSSEPTRGFLVQIPRMDDPERYSQTMVQVETTPAVDEFIVRW